MVISSSVVDDRVKLVGQLHVSDQLIHARHIHHSIHITFQGTFDLIDPAKVRAVHRLDLRMHGGGELFRMDVLLEDGEDLIKQLLLMQVVKLEGSVHLEDHGVLVSEPWKLLHDRGDQISVVSKSDMDVVARDNLPLGIHAGVDSSPSSTDFNCADMMSDIGSVGDGVAMTRMYSVLYSSFFISRLNEG